MKFRTIPTVGITLSLSLAVVAQDTPKPEPSPETARPLNVYMFAGTVGEPLSKSEKKARENELKRREKEAEHARKALYDKLKSQFGKDQDDWPEEQRKEYGHAWAAESMSEFALDYHRSGAVTHGKQADLDDSLHDILRAIRGEGLSRVHEWISLVEREEQAHLIVEVVDRAELDNPLTIKFGDHHKVLAVRISPAETQRFEVLEYVGPKENDHVRVRHAYSEEEPYWMMECSAIGNMWRNNAAMVASALNTFIKDRRPFLMGEVVIRRPNEVSKAAAGSERAVRTLRGHDGWVYAMSFSPDGGLLASGDGNGAVKIWDVATGDEMHAMSPHDAGVPSVTFSPDGRRLVSGSAAFPVARTPAQSALRVWEVPSGRELRTLPYHSARALAFQPNGERLAVSDGTEIRLLQTETWTEARTLQGNPSRVTGLSFSDGGSTLASWSQAENDVRLWNPDTGVLLRTLAAPPSENLGVMVSVFSPDGRWLAAANDQMVVRVWEVATGRVVDTYAGAPELGYVESATITADGRWLVTEGAGGAVNWWEITTDRTVKFSGHQGQPCCFAFSPARELMASSGGQDHTIKLWKVPPSEAKSIWPEGN